jgi:hypothetical protein
MVTSSTCWQCGAVLPVADDPGRADQLSSEACFAAYGRVLARCYEDAQLLRVRQLPVDAWAVQHPAPSSRVSDQSLALHLMTLHLFLEEGVDPERGPALHKSMMIGRPDYAWLEPPLHRGALTVADVSQPDRAHLEAWARAAWQAWADQHAKVLGWVDRWRQSRPPPGAASHN